ncbi:unnamed protein product [marine sediment metagenome]|uniref:UPF0261 domain-containing protein n=1 Tax=marine sediment metagenome TaxID=412755 RepID=X1TKP6_9ZZZZ
MKRVLSNAAGAISGMVEAQPQPEEKKTLVAITAMGVIEPAVENTKSLLEANGFETIVFHIKSALLDQMVQESAISGVIDLNTFELIRIFIYPGMPERKTRLESAFRKGLPVVIVPGGLDGIVLPVSADDIPEPLKGRKIYRSLPHVTVVRTTGEEMAKVAQIISSKANESEGPVAIVIPLQGFSAEDKAGHGFYEPETDAVFINEIKKQLRKCVKLIEVDAHINDAVFARKVADVFNRIYKR